MRFTLLAWLLVAMTATRGGPLAAQCVGDCTRDRTVTVDEILTMVNIALGGAQISACPAGDANHDARITVDEVLAAQNDALSGCAMVNTPTASPTPSGNSQPTPTPPAGCGNGRVDFNLGETCDDGNTLDGDDCPYNCRIAACMGTGTTRTVDVTFSVPAGGDLGGIKLFLRYPDGVVKIPGMASDDQVNASISNLPDNGFSTPNDLDYGLRLLLFTTDQTALSTVAPGLLCSIEFDNCQGAAAPTASDFRCTVEEALDPESHDISGVTCSVTLQ